MAWRGRLNQITITFGPITVAINVADVDKATRDEIKAASVDLGSDQLLQQINGLHGLDLIGQRNRGLRQLVIDLACKFLQEPPRDDRPLAHQSIRNEVQQLIIRHLRNGLKSTGEYWPGMRLGLAGATFVDLDMSYCTIGDANFSGARFIGQTKFGRDTEFTRPTLFTRATFNGPADFSETTFRSAAQFDSATFMDVSFVRARFYCLRIQSGDKPDPRRPVTRRQGSRNLDALVRQLVDYDQITAGTDGLKIPESSVDDGTLDTWLAYKGVSGHQYIRATRFDDATFRGSVDFTYAGFEHPDLPNFDGIHVTDSTAQRIWPSGISHPPRPEPPYRPRHR